jgi:hypothetical protein
MHLNNILVSEQYDFRRGIPTENAAFKLTDSIWKFINQGMYVGEIFCDAAKVWTVEIVTFC